MIPLGAVGRLALGGKNPLPWQVVGYVERCEVPDDAEDDEQSFWREYLLYHRTAGFAFLVDAEDGWSWAVPITGVPEGKGQTVKYQGRTYRQMYRYRGEITYVLGEFYWRLERGQQTKNSDYAAFFGAQSTQKARKYDSDAANANAVLSSQLQYIFAVSRIAHYMKAMMRDKIGSFAAASNVEDFLNRWLTQYVLLDDNASQEQKAQFPLREASVQVSEVPGRPGVYRAVSFLRPHFQLDELSVSLRLVAELPGSTKN